MAVMTMYCILRQSPLFLDFIIDLLSKGFGSCRLCFRLQVREKNLSDGHPWTTCLLSV